MTSKETLASNSKNVISNAVGNLKSAVNISKISINATIATAKKKVEDSLSKAVKELDKSRDYLKRINKAYKGGLDSAGKVICDEVSDSIDLAKKVVSKKGGFGKDALNLILDGCEKLTNTVIKGSIKLGKSTLNAVLGLSEKTIGAVEKVIDYVNPAPNQLSVKQIIKKVEDGSIKLTNNIQKGNYGEIKMDQYYASKGYVRISIDRVRDLDEPAHKGIDGVYYNVDQKKGEPTFIIGEAKYNQSKLGYTKYDGKQMSDRWILGNTRLKDDVGKNFASEIKEAIYSGNCEKQVVHVFPDGSYRIEIIK